MNIGHVYDCLLAVKMNYLHQIVNWYILYVAPVSKVVSNSPILIVAYVRINTVPGC